MTQKSAPPTAALLAFDRSPAGALLEAELLQHVDATWVERTEIGKVLDEQKLQALFAAEAVEERVRFGRLLKADLLVLVRPGKRDQINHLDVTIANTSRGLRLAHREFSMTSDPKSDVALMMQLVADGFARHRKPIDALFAIPPFLSLDLTHEHDELRAAYAQLIETQLLEQPNTLVVELAEADAIVRELSLAAPDNLTGQDTKIVRVLPHYIVGGYRNKGRGKDRRVEIQLALKLGSRELAQVKSELKPDDIPAFLQREVAGYHKQLTGRNSNLANPKVEARQLLSRAREHLKLGAYDEAATLAEASLLLDPKQVEPHVVVVRAITPFLKSKFNRQGGRLEHVQVITGCYLRGVEHLLQFYRNGGSLDDYPADGWGTFLSDFYAASSSLKVPANASPEVKLHMEEVMVQSRQMMLELIAFVIESSPSLANSFMIRAMTGFTENQMTDLKRELILRYQHLPKAREITRLLACGNRSLDFLDEPAGKSLLATLETDGNAQVRAEVAALRKLLIGMRASKEQHEKLRKQHAETLEPVPQGAKHVVVQPLKLEGTDSSGKKFELSSLDGVLATSAGFDVFWSDHSLFLMHQKGVLELVYSIQPSPAAHFSTSIASNGHSGICFDGTYVWTRCFDQNRLRLVVIDPKTRQVSELTAEHGLPDPNVGSVETNRRGSAISLAPIAPGKVLVAGSFGRAWLAVAEFQPGTAGKVRVFHEAKDTHDASVRDQWKKTSMSFEPGNIFPLTGVGAPANSPKRFLVGRIAHNILLLERPLLVDPAARTVKVHAEKLRIDAQTLDISPSNNLVYFIHSPPTQPQSLALARMSGFTAKVETLVPLPREGYVLAEPERVHVVGKQWWIVDLPEKTVTPAGPVPWQYRYHLPGSGADNIYQGADNRPPLRMLSRSNHYGIVAYYSGTKEMPGAIVQVTFEK